SLKLGDVIVSALAVVNAAGDILDWRSGQIVAGARRPSGGFADCVEVMKQDMANCGASRAIRPYHTTGDGDQLFTVSTRRLPKPDLPLTTVGSLAAEVAAEAI